MCHFINCTLTYVLVKIIKFKIVCTWSIFTIFCWIFEKCVRWLDHQFTIGKNRSFRSGEVEPCDNCLKSYYILKSHFIYHFVVLFLLCSMFSVNVILCGLIPQIMEFVGSAAGARYHLGQLYSPCCQVGHYIKLLFSNFLEAVDNNILSLGGFITQHGITTRQKSRN